MGVAVDAVGEFEGSAEGRWSPADWVKGQGVDAVLKS